MHCPHQGGGCRMETHFCNKLLSSRTIKWRLLIRERGTMKYESPNSKIHVNTAKPPAINGRSKAGTIKMLECEPALWPCSFPSFQPQRPLFHRRICSSCFGIGRHESFDGLPKCQLRGISPTPSDAYHFLSSYCSLQPCHHLSSPLHISLTEYQTNSNLIFPII